MFEVAHKVTVGSSEFKSAGHSRLVSLRTQAALDVPVNTASIVFAPPEGLTVSPGDKVSIELGAPDALEPVFAGVLDTADYRIDGLALHCSGSFRKLVAARFNLLYEKSKAGDVISDVTSRLDIDTGTVDSGSSFPIFTLSDTETVYEGLHRLAGYCGCDLYSDPSDSTVFAPYQPATNHRFQYGVNVVSLRVQAYDFLLKGAAVYGESPASLSQGPDAASWLTKKDILGQAGDSSGLVSRQFAAAARTQELAGAVATAVQASISEKTWCTLRTLGAPKVQLGHAIQIDRMPQAAQNTTFKVTGVEHRIDSKHGFVTIVRGVEV